MRTTDQSLEAAVLETTFRRPTLARAGGVIAAVRRALFSRRGNSLVDLSDRQLRDIGLTRDMLDPRIYGSDVRHGEDPHLPRTSATALLWLMGRGGA